MTDPARPSARERILREVELHGSVAVADLVAATGLHANTIREHLDRLHRDGRVRRERAEPHGRGRPAWRWRAAPAGDVNPYAGLALALADSLSNATEEPASQARAAGVRWGSKIVRDRDDPATDARSLVLEILREQGFAPDDSTPDILLNRCPLLAAAAQRSDVVCAVHEGMLAGIVRSRDERADAELSPLRAAGGCGLRLHSAS